MLVSCKYCKALIHHDLISTHEDGCIVQTLGEDTLNYSYRPTHTALDVLQQHLTTLQGREEYLEQDMELLKEQMEAVRADIVLTTRILEQATGKTEKEREQSDEPITPDEVIAELEKKTAERERAEKLEHYFSPKSQGPRSVDRRARVEDIVQFAAAEPHPGELTEVEYNAHAGITNSNRTLRDLVELGVLENAGFVWPYPDRKPHVKPGHKSAGKPAKLYKVTDFGMELITRPDPKETTTETTTATETSGSSKKEVRIHVGEGVIR